MHTLTDKKEVGTNPDAPLDTLQLSWCSPNNLHLLKQDHLSLRNLNASREVNN